MSGITRPSSSRFLVNSFTLGGPEVAEPEVVDLTDTGIVEVFEEAGTIMVKRYRLVLPGER